MLYYAICRAMGPYARCVVHDERNRLHIYTDSERANKVAKKLEDTYKRVTFSVCDISSTHTHVAAEDPVNDPKFDRFGEITTDEEEEESAYVENARKEIADVIEEVEDEEEGAYVTNDAQEKKGTSRSKLLQQLRGGVSNKKR